MNWQEKKAGLMIRLSHQTIAITEEPAPMQVSRFVLSQQHRVQRYAAASDAFRLFNRLTSPDLFDTLEASLTDHRERLFPPTETLSMFMEQALKPDRSCQGIVNDAAVNRMLQACRHAARKQVDTAKRVSGCRWKWCRDC